MADNDTQVQVSTWDDDFKSRVVMSRYSIVIYTSTALTIATFIYGVISWWLIKKFRNYRNFVFLNAIVANLFLVVIVLCFSYIYHKMSHISQSFLYQEYAVLHFFLYLYIGNVKIHWLIVICHMFYVDIVKVFNGQTKNIRLKSCLFAWGLPFVTSHVYTYMIIALDNVTSKAANIVLFMAFALPMILNSVLYITIVIALFRSSNASSQTTTSKWRRFYIATLIFLLSDTLIFSTYSFKNLNNSATLILIENIVNAILNPLIIYTYFVVVKRNRVLWYEFYAKKLNKRQRNRDIKNVRPNNDRRPVAINTQR